MNFHEHVDGHANSALQKLVLHPRKTDEKELKGLAKAVYAFFDECTNILTEVNELVLCKLKTVNPKRK